jgi:PAS domain-containing protein
MNKLLLSFLVFAFISFSTLASEEEDILNAITVLNEAASEFLGVSLEALTLLSQSGDGSYIPKSYLESSKRMNLIKQLKESGYVELEERFGLPDGQETKEIFMRIMPTKKGITVIASIRMVNHNKSMQPTANALSD